MMHKILVVDDEAKLRKNLCEFLSLNGYGTAEAGGGEEALERFRAERPSAVLLDLVMAGMHGIETMQRLRALDPTVPVIIVTGQADIPSAVHSIKEGAYDFLTKPVNVGHLLLTLTHATARGDLEQTVRELDSALTATLEASLGSSAAMKKVVTQVRRIAQSDFTLLIQGETGTGKTHLATLIHSLSKRAQKPFVKVSVGSLQDTVLESELFGHVKGAFTGADKARQGYFEAAQGGTLCIDDLDNIGLPVQGKLLSVIEEKRMFRVGSTMPIALDLRLIGATNADLLKAVAERRFREDLFFRASEVTLFLPPLRERTEDIEFFARKFLYEACVELNVPVRGLAEDTLDLLRTRPWPGNLRQLKNVMKRAALLTQEDTIAPDEIEPLLTNDSGRDALPPAHDEPIVTIADAERIAVRNALAATKGQKLKAASLLGIDYKTLVRKMKEYRIE